MRVGTQQNLCICSTQLGNFTEQAADLSIRDIMFMRGKVTKQQTQHDLHAFFGTTEALEWLQWMHLLVSARLIKVP